jgi:hypothetical protein
MRCLKNKLERKYVFDVELIQTNMERVANMAVLKQYPDLND